MNQQRFSEPLFSQFFHAYRSCSVVTLKSCMVKTRSGLLVSGALAGKEDMLITLATSANPADLSIVTPQQEVSNDRPH